MEFLALLQAQPDWTNVTSFHVPWIIDIVLLLAWFAMSYPDIKYSSQFKNVGYTEGNPLGLWNNEFGFFETKPNIIATVAMGIGFLVAALLWFSPLMIGLVAVAGPVRLIYALTKLKKDIDFRKEKQHEFLDKLSTVTDTSDAGLAAFFGNLGNYQDFTWGTAGAKIVSIGGHWTYKLFPFIFSTQSDAVLAATELNRSLYNLSLKPDDQRLPQ